MKNFNIKYDFLIVGSGIFGIIVVVELVKRKYKVVVINFDIILYYLVVFIDIIKVVCMEYGIDKEYFFMVEICIDWWKDWNDLFGKKLYNEVGFLMLCKDKIEGDCYSFEKLSY